MSYIIFYIITKREQNTAQMSLVEFKKIILLVFFQILCRIHLFNTVIINNTCIMSGRNKITTQLIHRKVKQPAPFYGAVAQYARVGSLAFFIRLFKIIYYIFFKLFAQIHYIMRYAYFIGNLFCIVCYLFKFCVINHFDGNCTNIITLIFEQKAGYTAVKTAGQGNGDFTLIGQNIPHLHLLKCIQYIRWFLLNPVLS